ncbi:DUF3305 domain-containing protein [Vibrio olivae]|uniref:DUF3305 domain-containing protein n=1 Tax=Vibrio olivae TaxID=1243002 RepID=A0ABV5HIT7_9VIBR
MVSTTKAIKTQCSWLMGCNLKEHQITTGVGVLTQWQLTGFDLEAQQIDSHTATLALSREQEFDYRNNLFSLTPKLYLIIEASSDLSTPLITQLTASKSVANEYMNSEYLVLTNEMPGPVQAWLADFVCSKH